jgi:hypothetical protein
MRVSRSATAIECPACGLYAGRGVTTAREREQQDCVYRAIECCVRAFVCKSGHRTVAIADAPEME